MGAGEVPGLEGLTPSYLSIDTHSRVVRLDSWSKVLAPGLRLGWVTAHPDMVDLMALALHASLNGPPGVSQVFQPPLHICFCCSPATCGVAACTVIIRRLDAFSEQLPTIAWCSPV